MAIKFEKIEPGMVLYDVHSENAGNTTMRRLGKWEVRIISVDKEKRTAMASWNGNRAELWHASRLEKLRAKITPKMEAKLRSPYL
jgi:hypothetical protein